MTAHILVVDVESAARKQLRSALEQKDISLVVKASFREALSHIKQHGHELELAIISLPPDVSEGLQFISSAVDMGLDLPIIVQLGQGNIADVAEVMRAGAFDFILQPSSRERLFASISAALKVTRAGKNRMQRKSRPNHVQFSAIISASQSMMRAVSLARKAAHSNIPVVLEGESGVGKRLIARAIHSACDRSSKPFLTVDCSAFTANASDAARSEQELAGWHRQLQEAEGGTLYLSEVGDLPASLQARLLDLVQSGLSNLRSTSGHSHTQPRIISSSSKDLIEEVRAGRFREDLYYRLNVFPILIPALRRRKEDIPHLVRMFCEQCSSEQRKARVLTISASAMSLLTRFDWPGNIRQLENAIYRAVTLADRSELTEADFSQIDAQMVGERTLSERLAGPELIISNSARSNDISSERSMLMAGGQQAMKANSDVSGAQNTVERMAISSIDEMGELRPLAEIEEELIRFALGFYRGQMSQVARKLGIGRSTLYRKLKDYGIDPDDPLRNVA